MSNLNLAVIISAIDKFTAPAKRVLGTSEQLSTQVKATKAELDRLGRLQGDVEHLRRLREQTSATEAKLNEARTTASALGRQMAAAGVPTLELSRDFQQARAKVEQLEAALGTQRQALSTTRSSLEAAGIRTHDLDFATRQLTAQTQQYNRVLEQQRAQLDRVTQAAAARAKVNEIRQANRTTRGELMGEAVGTAAVGYALAQPIRAAIQFESVMADVRKVVDFDTPQQFQQMSGDLLNLSRRLPMAAQGLGEIMAAAGQAGIARNELLRFTEDAAKMGVAFDMSGAEAGSAMTGLRTIFHLNQDQVVGLGDAYNHLSNNMDATARDMVNIANRTGSMAAMAGLTGQQVGALGAAFLAMKTPPEIASTGINALLQRLSTAKEQSADFQKGLHSLGFSAEELQDQFANDAQGAILSVLESLKGLDKQAQMTALSQMFGAEHADDIAKLVGGLDTYKKALGLVSDATQYAGSMNKEYETRAGTTANNITLLSNRVTALGVNIGSVLLPPLNIVSGVLGALADFVAAVSQKFPFLTQVIMVTAVSLIALKLAAIGARYAGTLLSDGFLIAKDILNFFRLSTLQANAQLAVLKIQTIASAAATRTAAAAHWIAIGATKAWTIAQWAWNVAMTANPIGLIIIAVAALIAIGVALYQYWEPIKEFFGGLWDGIKEKAASAWAFLKEMFSWSPFGIVFKLWGAVFDWLGSKFEWFGKAWKTVKSWFGLDNGAEQQQALPEPAQQAAQQVQTIPEPIKQATSPAPMPVTGIAKAAAISASLVTLPAAAIEPVTPEMLPTQPALIAPTATADTPVHVEVGGIHISLSATPDTDSKALLAEIEKQVDIKLEAAVRRAMERTRGRLHD